MSFDNSNSENYFSNIYNLIENRNFTLAENLLNSVSIKNDKYYYFYSILLETKAWFDTALIYLNKAISINPDNPIYNDRLMQLSRRHRRYSDNYYGGYRRNRGCACCCCDDCCCDCGNFSCCDLICLDQCCECMGGDLIDCI